MPHLSGSASTGKGSNVFLDDLRVRVRAYLRDDKVEFAAKRLHRAKAALLGCILCASYFVMLFAGSSFTLLTSAVSVGFALAGLAFNVQHDGGHGAFSGKASCNSAASRVLDLLGMSSYLWRWKHNLLHHENPNIDRIDGDVDAAPFLRLHPSQEWHWWHQYQHYYCWVLYSFVTVRWVFVSDLLEMWRGKIGEYSYPPMSRSERSAFWVSKMQFAVWAVLIPSVVHGPAAGLAFFLVFEMTGGFLAGLCFQLAHAVEEAEHFDAYTAQQLPWAERQLAATVDFQAGAVVSWYLGGLNHQTVHHLFPGVRHTHYPRIAGMLERAAESHGLSYRRNPSLCHQVRSHYRLMKHLGSTGRPVENG